MCGIVSFFGANGAIGVRRVLDALALLSYRAPDSSGLAVLDAQGQLVIRRAVGDSMALQTKIAEDPFPPLRQTPIEVVVGHGRWAMVGAVTEANAHPLADRSGERIAVENGSHNAARMLAACAEQERWWRQRGIPEDEPVHRSENTTEVLTYEWERLVQLLREGAPPPDSTAFLAQLDEWEVDHPEERALRLAVWRLQAGNAHACAFYGRRQPDVLYVTSHNKPVAIAMRTDTAGQRQVMVASDVNAALMLWPLEEVAAAATEIERLQAAAQRGEMTAAAAKEAVQAIVARFTAEVIFLDGDLFQGKELFARISTVVEDGRVQPQVEVSRYDGRPVQVAPRPMALHPAMVGKGSYASYTERHIAEIPEVLDRLATTYTADGQVRLNSIWREDEDGQPQLFSPGVNVTRLQQRFGPELAGLQRVLLIGEGSSWRDAQAAAPLFRRLLPDVPINVYRPVSVLNLGQAVQADGDLAVEISWSGTTDSLLKVDRWLAEQDVLRLAITGRPQSDLGRRAAGSGGTVDVHTGVEVSVATVKGYEGLLMTLDLLAVQLATLRGAAEAARWLNELALVIPQRVRTVVEDDQRRRRLQTVAGRCRFFNKVAVVGDSPVDIEAELKIEELAQVVALVADFHSPSLRPLMERNALVEDDRQRTLFVINATTPAARREARFIVNYLRELGVFCIIHTTPHEQLSAWEALPNAAVFVSPEVASAVQPLVDAPFFFDLAVALAYARGLTPAEIDRPRNLAKSVTTTGAERRDELEARADFNTVSLAEFAAAAEAEAAWDATRPGPSRAALRATTALRGALTVISDPLPPALALDGSRHLLVTADTESTENGARMAAATWQRLLTVDVTVYRRFLTETPRARPDTALLRVVRAGAVLAVRDQHTVALPADLTPLQLELLTAVYFIGLAVRLARQRGAPTSEWAAGLARLPLLAARILSEPALSQRLDAALQPFVTAGYDKVQIIGGGQDYAAAISLARSLRSQGFMAEALYTDSAWHGPLATVGGPGAERDTLMVVLATDPLFQAAAMVDTQVYKTRNAHVLLVVPEGSEVAPAVAGLGAAAVLALPTVPRPFAPVIGATFGGLLARRFANLWQASQVD